MGNGHFLSLQRYIKYLVFTSYWKIFLLFGPLKTYRDISVFD